MKRYAGAPQAIHTSTWFTKLPPGYSRVGISLYTPRGFKGERWDIKQLAPGRWYNTVPPQQYLELYNAILQNLDPQTIVDALYACGPNPVMVCYESPASIAAGTKFCHRHLAAKWLTDTLGLPVREIEHPDLYPFKVFDRLSIPVPKYQRPEPVNILAGG